MKKFTPVFALMLFFSLLMACSPSSKNETQYWENHKKAAEEYKTSYPGMATLIDENIKAATAVMDEAAKLTDEKQKAEKMKAGNEIAQGFVGKITEVKTKREGLEKTITKLADLKLPKEQSNKRKDAMKEAQTVVDEVNTALIEAKPENKEAAETLLKDQVSKLISAQGAADRAYNSLKPKKEKKSKKKN